MNSRSYWIIIALSLIAVFSCSKQEELGGLASDEASVCLTPVVRDAVITKSSISAAENKLSSVSIGIYDKDGQYVTSKYFTDLSAVSIPKLHIGERYYIYAAFNMGKKEYPLKKEQVSLANYVSHTWDKADISSNGFPMVWSGKVDLTSDGQTVQMDATRLVSKVTFSIDNSDLATHKGKFTVSALSLKNAAERIAVFADKNAQCGKEAMSSDQASASDITALNTAGGSASFYCFENMGGTLLPTNTNPWNKVPDNIGTDSAASCTYLEVTGTYSTDGGAMSVPVTYRMYLGENSTTNFDLMRNYVYRVSLQPSDEGVGRTSWKVTRGDFSDSRKLEFTPASVDMNLNGSVGFTVTPTPSDMVYSLEGGAGFDASTLSIVPTGTANEYSLVSSGTLSADAVTSVKAVSWDGRVTASLPVTVRAKVLKGIRVSPDDTTVREGATVSYRVIATYDQGGVLSDEDVTGEATYTVSNPEGVKVAVMGSGADRNTATAVEGGTAGITATFAGMKSSPTKFRTLYPVTITPDFPYYGGTGTWAWDFWKSGSYVIGYTVGIEYDDGSTRTLDPSEYVISDNSDTTRVRFPANTKRVENVGSVDNGGSGTVKFSYTEAGHTVSKVKQWYKVCVTAIKPYVQYKGTYGESIDGILYKQTYTVTQVILKYNYGDDEKVTYPASLGELNAKFNNYIVVSGRTITGLRYGKTPVYSKTSFRNVKLSGDIYSYCHMGISATSSGTKFDDLDGQTIDPAATYYVVLIDADGYYNATGNLTIHLTHGTTVDLHKNKVTGQELIDLMPSNVNSWNVSCGDHERCPLKYDYHTDYMTNNFYRP